MLEKIIAIDGPSGAGKSSLTKEVAKQLGLMYIDSGAIYRTAAVCAFELFKENEVDKNLLLTKLNKSLFRYQPSPNVLIEFNGQDISKDIRNNSISMMSSKISALPEIRAWVNSQLHLIVKNSAQICIMEGRDIGTVIFPNAILKFFLTANAQVRAKRRFEELKNLNKLGNLTEQKILDDINARDLADSTRNVAPLTCATDAIKIDTSSLSFKEVLDNIVTLAKKSLNSI